MSAREQFAVGHSLRMKQSEYEHKVRTMVGTALSSDERKAVALHYDKGTEPEKLASTLLVLRKIDRARRQIRDAEKRELALNPRRYA